MTRPSTIYCPQCGEPCGRQYPDYPATFDSGGEPGYAEGKGEDYSWDGVWHCSEKCRQKTVMEDEEESESALELDGDDDGSGIPPHKR